MDNSSVQPHQMHLPHRPMPSCTNPPSIPAGRYLPPIQKLQAPGTYPAYSTNAAGVAPRDISRNSINFPVGPCGGHHYQQSHVPRSLDQPRPYNDLTRMALGLPRSCPQGGEYRIPPVHSQEPDYKRCRLGSEAWPASLEVSAWEIDALAVAKSKNASGRASNQQASSQARPTCSWTTPGNLATESHPHYPVAEHSRKNDTWQQHNSAYPSPPHTLDDSSRRSSHRGLTPQGTPSVFSRTALTGSPAASWSTVASDGRGSPPASPAITSTTSWVDSRPGSMGPGDSIPTFEEIYDVPQVDLAPRETARRSILERLPMEIFMRIMLYCDWKQQIQLRRCNSNIYGMVMLDAIPWETKTAVLLHEENFNPKNFPKKIPAPQDGGGPGGQDSDSKSSPGEELPSPSKPVKKGKRSRGKGVFKPGPRAKEKTIQDNFQKFACYLCFKILPAYYFEGKHLENHSGRATVKGSQKKRGHNSQSNKKVDTRVEYVQVISVNPSRRPPEWLVRDKAEVRAAAAGVGSYVAEHMRKGVNCDDLRLHYKDLHSGTHCIAPLRGVDPFFTASSPSATPGPGCETYRPVYQVEAGPSRPGAAGADGSAYTYEICIPEGSERDESPAGRPRTAPCARICQPQPQQQQATADAPGAGPPAPAPQVNEVIALRRFCIPCGARYGAYRRECNRKIISSVTEQGWWVCACPKVRPAGIGRNCPDCGKSVIY